MLKSFSLLILLTVFLLPAVNAANQNNRIYIHQINTINTLPLNLSAGEEILILDKTQINSPCPKGYISRCPDDTFINVKIAEIVSKHKSNKYSYSITGGHIIGQGKKIKWDLAGVRPGTYQITVNVTNIHNFAVTETKTITVSKCTSCGGDCTCPTLVAYGPTDTIPSDKLMIFTANVSDGAQDNVTYKWTVSKGKIIEGKGTPVIKVKTKGLAGKTVTATVEIGGICADCTRIASATGDVSDKKP